MGPREATQPVTVRQHYVAAGYLAGFTQGGKRDSIFYVHPLDGSPVRIDKPENVAFERNYNSIKVEGLRKDHLEGIFRKRFEGPACDLFKTLSDHPGRPFVTEDELAIAIQFLALQAARVPRSRAKYEEMVIQNGKDFLHKLATSPEFEQEVARAAAEIGEDLLSQDDVQKLLAWPTRLPRRRRGGPGQHQMCQGYLHGKGIDSRIVEECAGTHVRTHWHSCERGSRDPDKRGRVALRY